jgi:hypothetical protein
VGDRKTIKKRLESVRWRARSGYGREPASVAAAARYYGLDPKNPRQRETLFYILADAIFDSRKRGRPWGSKTSWGQRLITLGEIYREKKYKNPKLSDAKIAKLIKQDHAEFKNDDPDQIRQRLRAAEEAYSDWYFEFQADNEPPEDWEPPDPDYDDD